jgi:hypothetical protein
MLLAVLLDMEEKSGYTWNILNVTSLKDEFAVLIMK